MLNITVINFQAATEIERSMGIIQIETTALVKHILEQKFIIFFVLVDLQPSH